MADNPLGHDWDVSPEEALEIQRQLADQVIIQPLNQAIEFVAGVDVGFEDGGRTTRAAVAVLRFPELELVESQVVRQPTCFPYRTGLLSFRECPAIMAALNRLTIAPDVLLCDGQGLAHPRRLGIACHLGLLTGLPAIGVGKSRLTGQFTEPGLNKGDSSPLIHKGDQVGTVLRTRARVKPLFISPGHLADVPSSVDLVMACLTRYRLPETTRHAHRLASGPRAR